MRRILARASLILPMVSIACSSNTEQKGAFDGLYATGGSTGSGTGSGASKGTGATNGVIFGGGASGPVSTGNQSCVTQSIATEAAPLDIYVMFDQSCSMSCPAEEAGPGLCCVGGPNPRIDQVRTAMNDFLSNPKSAGIGVGIGYFGYLALGQTSCNPTDYATPAVPIAPLPGNTQAIEQSLQGAQPTGETPTGAAIRGACTYATSWKKQNPGRQVVVLLVTDGVPEAPVSRNCKPTLPDAEAAAKDCISQSAIQTYVLGVGANLDNLSGLAQAGGTDHAYLAGTMDVSTTVLDALNQIRDGAAVPCKFKVPPAPSGQTLDPTLVNVGYDDSAGAEHLVPSAGTSSNCAMGGWYYDDAQNPTTLSLCPSSCDTVTAQLVAAAVLHTGAKLNIEYGCSTVSVTR
ncbi:MAG TPA: vWA domain-containing protein [Polyangiaceae bacterium]|jgi:hypothetical protein|nr:vWA domain-containing protein [Polyangiaceae bacterium]